MPRRAPSVCPRCGTRKRGRCPQCERTRQQTVDQRRPTAHQRGYTTRHHRRFRTQVLARDFVCTCPGCPRCSVTNHRCLRASTDADHHPRTRRELEAAGEDPDDPAHGRGLCHPCHSHKTATADGGFGRKRR